MRAVKVWDFREWRASVRVGARREEIVVGCCKGRGE